MNVELRNPKGQPLTTADRSNAVSESLRQIARASRFADRNKGIRSYQSHVKTDPWIPVLFLALCVVPTLLCAVYFGVIASDIYVTEARFAIRPAIGATDKAADDGSSGSGGSSGSSGGGAKQLIAQDTLITASYIASRPMIEAIEKQMPVREMFSREGIDRLARFDAEKPIEKFLKYWDKRVTTAIAPGSGIVTLTVEAFDPQDSFDLARAILTESERMVNQLSSQLRDNALAETTHELKLAEVRMDKLRYAMRDLRNRDGTLDASKTNDTNLKIVTELRNSRIQLAVQLAMQQRDLAPDSRRILDTRAQMKNLDEQIEQIEHQTTSQDPERRRVLADSLGQFEAYDNERLMAEKYFARMLAAHERARIIAERQVEFFSPVVLPVLAQSAERPRRLLMVCLIGAGSLVVFALSLVFRRMAS